MGLGRWSLLSKRRRVHEATRRAWCRLAFMLGGALPVLCTVVLVILEYLPLYQELRAAYYEQVFSQATGLTVQLDRVELLTPTRRIARGIQLKHPETGETLGKLHSVWMSESATGCAIKGLAPQIEADRASELFQLLHQSVLSRPNPRAHAVVLSLDGLTLSGLPEQQLELKLLRCELRRHTHSTHARCTLEIAGIGADAATVTFQRQHNDALPTSKFSLNTGGQRLPGRWVKQFASELSIPGEDASFSGNFELECNQLGWILQGQGRLSAIDVTTWFDRPVLSGKADVELTHFTLSDRYLRDVSGKLLVQHGRIHPDLIRAAAYIGIRPSSTWVQALSEPQASEPPAFTMLGAEFALDWRGLRIIPISASSSLLPERAIAVDQLGPLALYNVIAPGTPIPTENLVVVLSLITQANDLLKSPTVRKLVQWLPSSQSPEGPRTASSVP